MLKKLFKKLPYFRGVYSRFDYLESRDREFGKQVKETKEFFRQFSMELNEINENIEEINCILKSFNEITFNLHEKIKESNRRNQKTEQYIENVNKSLGDSIILTQEQIKAVREEIENNLINNILHRLEALDEIDLKELQNNVKKINNERKYEKVALANYKTDMIITLHERKKNFDYKLGKMLKRSQYEDALIDWYYDKTGEILDLASPKTLNEKIQWIKLYGIDEKKEKLTDKLLVRDWIKDRIGTDFLIPLLGVWDKFDDIDFNSLPERFVLKLTNGSSWNIIVNDKKKFDEEEARNKINKWSITNYAFYSGFELQYKNIKPNIIAEAYIENESEDLYDYKFWCFNGKVEFILLVKGRYKNVERICYNTNWEVMPFSYQHSINETKIRKPDNLDKMIEISEKLSEGFDFVRVDLYRLNDGKILFGEMTFTCDSGIGVWEPKEYDKIMGDLLNLNL